MWIVVILVIVGIIVAAVVFEAFRILLFKILGGIALLIISLIVIGIVIYIRNNSKERNKEIKDYYLMYNSKLRKFLVKMTISARSSEGFMDGYAITYGNEKFIYNNSYRIYFREQDYELLKKNGCLVNSKYRHCIELDIIEDKYKPIYSGYPKSDVTNLLYATAMCNTIGLGLNGMNISINGRDYVYSYEAKRFVTASEYEKVLDNVKEAERKAEEQYRKRAEEERRRAEEQKKKREEEERRKREESKRGSSESYSPKVLEGCKILGVDPAMVKDKEFLKAAYRARLKKIHPDAGGSDDESKRVNNAYDYLNKL